MNIKNNKGFTLIELLAVIVILAVIILIAASNIGAMTTTARKNVLAVEGNTLVESAKTAYQLAILDGNVTTGTACFSLDYLYYEGFFDKGPNNSPAYSGSVLIQPDSAGKIYTYTFWISDSSYLIDGAPLGAKGKAANNGTNASNSCGSATNLTLFSHNGTSPSITTKS